MNHYYVNNNAQPNGDHEVHKDTCPYFNSIISKTYLGYFASCFEALLAAKRHYNDVDGCTTCSNACHKS